MTVYVLWWGDSYGHQDIVGIYLKYDDAVVAKAERDAKLDPGQRSCHDVEAREVRGS